MKGKNDTNSNLLKDYKKEIKKYIKFIPVNFIVYIVDICVFISLFTLFIVNRFFESDYISWSIIALCLYTMFRFSFLNWFQKNKYYKKIVVYNFKEKVGDGEMLIQREVSYNSINFWIIIIIINLSTAFFANYEVATFLSNVKIMLALTNTALNMLLLPSFLFSFQQIGQIDKNVASNYHNLLKDQFFSNKSLFDDVEFEDYYLHLKFKKNNLVSRNGLFIYINKDDVKVKDQQGLVNINKKILKIYKELWESYYHFLEEKSDIKVSKSRLHTQYWIERIYDHIFEDFFNL
ncbi:hypothetical protein SCORR_v1c04390 [Spiroplasma corruscae]|uniref:Uncharacterized protein n=1 Tax=Spiroplasma corruscae TaxID=216934 RepID=A0A222EPJ2_9MOLU|nr:hypothetical protein [Spiroplasma corruscae]ASP28213.1 hypothetical protein SCORR_v1c04390 [Spiroplasma corruscae]